MLPVNSFRALSYTFLPQLSTSPTCYLFQTLEYGGISTKLSDRYRYNLHPSECSSTTPSLRLDGVEAYISCQHVSYQTILPAYQHCNLLSLTYMTAVELASPYNKASIARWHLHTKCTSVHSHSLA